MAVTWTDVLARVSDETAPHIGQYEVAQYIPALANVDPNKFGLAVATHMGSLYETGDAAEPFSIQSVSKVFTLALALREVGGDLWHRLGREPSGNAFNSIVQLEYEHGIPRNPFINAGALVVVDILISRFGTVGAIEEIVDCIRTLSDNPKIGIDRDVAQSELETSHRNRGLAHLMKEFGNIQNTVDDVIDVYCQQCAIAVSCQDLARAGLFLSNEGKDPETGVAFCKPAIARRINAIMLTCGHYDAAGDFAFRVGLPGKSGVGGGILAIAPRQLSIAVWSPGLNEFGNSAAGTAALESLVQHADLVVL